MGASVREHCSMLTTRQHVLERFQPIGFARGLVPAQPINSGEAHRNTGLMTCRALQSLECHFHHEYTIRFGRALADRAETIDGIPAHKSVDQDQFFVSKSEI